MMDSGATSVPLQVSRGCVIASIQVDLSDEILSRFREDLLELVHTSGANGIILDVSGIEVMDHRDFEALRSTMAMAQLMGARTVLSGLRAGVVSALVELGVDSDDVVAARDLDDAFTIMESLRAPASGEGVDGGEGERFPFAPPDHL